MEHALFTWTRLAKVQRWSVVRTMYIWLFIVPMIAKPLSKIKETIDITVFSHSFSIEFGLPFSWKVFYLCAIIFATANIIFVGRCYTLIKDHKDFSHFLEAGKERRQLEQYAELSELRIDSLPAKAQVTKGMEIEGQYLKKPFWDLYDKMASGRKWSRRACALLYGIGLLLLGTIVKQNIEAVWKLSFGS
jgi:hypothetical protein